MNSHIPHLLKAIPALLLLLSFLPEVEAAQTCPSKLSVEYVYAPDGMLAGRTVNGQIQRFEYDKRGQLLAVKDAQGNDLERYVYDPAGNILSKTVHGRTTRFTYDAANQITSRTNPDGRVIQYQYDAAGRLIQEETRSYVYGYQDKVEEIRENGKTVAQFTYGLDGQLETVTRADGREENFYWDGLALIGRGKSTFINEPHVTGGNPIASDGKTMLNDMLGSTVGIRDGEKMTPVSMTAFGESSDPKAMYTGKPHVDGLGYAFLFRNYRASLGKWQTADPLGYPDGWNQLAYCKNNPRTVDPYGLCHWRFEDGTFRSVPMSETDPIANAPEGAIFEPCAFIDYLADTSLVPWVYFDEIIYVFCGETLHVYIPEFVGTGTMHRVFYYHCNLEDVQNHDGLIFYEIIASVYVHPVVRSYACLRKEYIDFVIPDDFGGPSYSVSVLSLETVKCE